MTFEFESSEDVPSQVEKVASSELGSAVALLADSDGDVDIRIHETRKHVKKLRALLQLVRPNLERETFEKTNALLRQVAKRLAVARDAAAQLESWDALLQSEHTLDEALRVTVREKLVNLRDRAANGEALQEAMYFAGYELGQILQCASLFRPARQGWNAIGPGLRETYKRGRTALDRVEQKFSDEALHHFRRFVKQHQYQAQLLEPAFPDVLHAHRGAASDLGEMLGHHHDLCVVENTLAAHEADFDPSSRTSVADVTRQRKAELVTKAYALAFRLYAERPRRLERRFAAYFSAWSKEQRAVARASSEAEAQTAA